jgi:hypothetical protein
MKTLLTYLTASLVALGAAPAIAEPAIADPATTESASSRVFSIVAPSSERPIFDEAGIVVVSFAAEPPLGEGDRIVVRVDAQIVVLPSGLTKFSLTGVTPGTHILEGLLVDADDNPVVATETVTFQVGAGFRI